MAQEDPRMRFSCPQCGQDLSVSGKVQGRSLSVRCSRCQQAIVLMPAAPAPQAAEAGAGSATSTAELASLLREALRGAAHRDPDNDKAAEVRRRVLLCMGNKKLRDEIASGLGALAYEPITTEGTHHALATMQDSKVDILVLDALFEMEEKGYKVMLDYVTSLHPKARRRVFVVLISAEYKSLDSRAAFNEHVNLIVNPRNVPMIQRILERSIKEYNEFYKTFNQLSGAEPF